MKSTFLYILFFTFLSHKAHASDVKPEWLDSFKPVGNYDYHLSPRGGFAVAYQNKFVSYIIGRRYKGRISGIEIAPKKASDQIILWMKDDKNPTEKSRLCIQISTLQITELEYDVAPKMKLDKTVVHSWHFNGDSRAYRLKDQENAPKDLFILRAQEDTHAYLFLDKGHQGSFLFLKVDNDGVYHFQDYEDGTLIKIKDEIGAAWTLSAQELVDLEKHEKTLEPFIKAPDFKPMPPHDSSAFVRLQIAMKPRNHHGTEDYWLGAEEDLQKIINDDDILVKNQGLTHEAIARPLLLIVAAHHHKELDILQKNSYPQAELKKDQLEYILDGAVCFQDLYKFRWHMIEFGLICTTFKSPIESPFSTIDSLHPIIGRTNYGIINKSNNKRLMFSEMHGEMIRRYAFYEGKETSANNLYRIEPAAILEIFPWLKSPESW